MQRKWLRGELNGSNTHTAVSWTPFKTNGSHIGKYHLLKGSRPAEGGGGSTTHDQHSILSLHTHTQLHPQSQHCSAGTKQSDLIANKVHTDLSLFLSSCLTRSFFPSLSLSLCLIFSDLKLIGLTMHCCWLLLYFGVIHDSFFFLPHQTLQAGICRHITLILSLCKIHDRGHCVEKPGKLMIYLLKVFSLTLF